MTAVLCSLEPTTCQPDSQIQILHQPANSGEAIHTNEFNFSKWLCPPGKQGWLGETEPRSARSVKDCPF